MSSSKYNISMNQDEQPQDIGVTAPRVGELKVLQIEGLAAGGRGVARDDDGRVWFVPDGIPGDRVEVRVERIRRRSGEARVVRRLEEGPERREAPCAVQAHCGGCPWMVLEPTAQARYKTTLIEDALQRIGGVEQPRLDPLQSIPPLTGYRNRIELTFAQHRKGNRLGFRQAGSSQLVDIAHCEIFATEGARLLTVVRQLLGCAAKPHSDTLDVPADRPRIMLRCLRGGRFAVIVRVQGRPLTGITAFAAELVKQLPEVSGVVEVTLRRGGRAVKKRRLLAGEGTLQETLGGIRFDLPIDAFSQVHPAAAEALTRTALEAMAVQPGERWLDLYAGAGVYGISAVRRGACEALICEIDSGLVEAGRAAAGKSGSGAIRFFSADVTEFLRGLQQPANLDGVVVNPPRGGMGREAVRALLDLRPRRWIWISCDPVPFARDLKEALAAGYVLRRVVPFDLFPQTAHVETLAVLEASG